jgi:hypothetical protein
MATKSIKTSKPTAKSTKTSAPKIARAKKSDAAAHDGGDEVATAPVAADESMSHAIAPDADRGATMDASPMTPSRETVAARAYERWCARGFDHGHDVEDWLAAEHELSSKS